MLDPLPLLHTRVSVVVYTNRKYDAIRKIRTPEKRRTTHRSYLLDYTHTDLPPRSLYSVGNACTDCAHILSRRRNGSVPCSQRVLLRCYAQAHLPTADGTPNIHRQPTVLTARKGTRLVVEPALLIEVVEVRLIRVPAPEIEVRDFEAAPEVAAVVCLAVGIGYVAHRIVFGKIFRMQFDEIYEEEDISLSELRGAGSCTFDVSP